MVKLGKIKKLDVRKVWKHEQYDFSKWLSEEDNINELGEKLGLSLVDVETEKNVGNYRCDIICKDEITGKTVLIENQLEPTNHDHLGKIITYASGLDASVIVWIVTEVREEHSSAIEWLNKHTDESLSFFLIQISAIQIGDSDIAPLFDIVEQPNDFSRNLKKVNSKEGISSSQASRLDFWTRFNDVLAVRKEFNVRKASTDHWYDFSIGTSACHLSADLINKEHKIRINLWIPPYNDNAKDLFDSLHTHKNEIELSIGHSLEWNRLDGKKACRVYSYIPNLDFDDDSNYNELFNQIIDELVKFRQAFKPYL